jgi:hypothetical protein
MQLLLKKINLFGHFYKALHYFITKNKGRTARQKVFSLLHPTSTSGPLHRYIDHVIITAVLVSVMSIILEMPEIPPSSGLVQTAEYCGDLHHRIRGTNLQPSSKNTNTPSGQMVA